MSSNNKNEDYLLVSPEMRRMANERSKASFNVRLLTEKFFGGKDYVEAKEKIYRLVERDEILNPKRPYDMNIDEIRESTMRKVRRGLEIRKMLRKQSSGSAFSSSSSNSNNVDQQHVGDEGKMVRIFDEVMDEFDSTYYMRIYVHFTLFGETIWAQGTSEQYKKWAPLVKDMKVIGCFSMTELGHSSFLRGLETTADYDHSKKHFIINTPSLTATKWWIGMSGHTATHTAVLAQCRINGVSKGLNWFIVPMRNKKTGQLLPGVAAGGLGSKVGKAGVDNGWIQFSNVVVPFENMLSRWGSIDTRTGTYSSPKNPQIAYSTLVGERIWASEATVTAIAQASTIAARYGVIRLQGSRSQQIMSYQSHQYIILPILARAYALKSVVLSLRKNWSQTQILARNPKTIPQFLADLPDYHCTAAALKASFGWWNMDAIEQLRRTTGGHGYSAYNKIAMIWCEACVGTTGGGDNIVLAQQAARYLVRTWQKLMSNNSMYLGNSVGYLREFASNPQSLEKILCSKWNVKSTEDLENFSVLFQAAKFLSVYMILKSVNGLSESMAKHASKQNDSKLLLETAWNDNLIQLVDTVEVHCFFYSLSKFYNFIGLNENKNQSLSKEQKILSRLWILYACHSLQENLQNLYEGSFVTPNQAKLLKKKVLQLCEELREQVIPLTDVFNIPDFVLNSQIATKDGDIYRKYVKYIKDGPDSYSTAKYWNREVAPLVNPDHYHQYNKPLFSKL